MFCKKVCNLSSTCCGRTQSSPSWRRNFSAASSASPSSAARKMRRGCTGRSSSSERRRTPGHRGRGKRVWPTKQQDWNFELLLASASNHGSRMRSGHGRFRPSFILRRNRRKHVRSLAETYWTATGMERRDAAPSGNEPVPWLIL